MEYKKSHPCDSACLEGIIQGRNLNTAILIREYANKMEEKFLF